MSPILAIAFFVFGLAFGSFLNVCISRIPNDLSVIAPRSHCPLCQSPISWRDNVPLLSWILLRRHCRACGQPISLRYPLVELLTGLLFLACYASFGFSGMACKACVLCFLLVGLIFMDAETGLLPAEFTYPGIGLGLLFAWLAPGDSSGARLLLNAFGRQQSPSPALLSVLDSVVAAACSAGFFFLAWAVYFLARKRDGLGFGDIALMAMIGAFLGLKLTAIVLFLAPVSATLYAVAMLATRLRGQSADESAPDSFLSLPIPFGVFLGGSAIVVIFMGDAIWRWYLGFFR